MSNHTERRQKLEEWKKKLEEERKESEISWQKTSELIAESHNSLVTLANFLRDSPQEEYPARIPRNFPTAEGLLSNLVATEINPCVVCLANVPNWVILPCGHTNCGKCIHELHERDPSLICPKCRTPIQEIVQIYI